MKKLSIQPYEPLHQTEVHSSNPPAQANLPNNDLKNNLILNANQMAATTYNFNLPLQ